MNETQTQLVKREYNRQYRLKNLGRLKEADRLYYQGHKQQNLEHGRRWREKNREKDRELHRKSYRKNFQKRNEAHKRYNAIHRVRLLELERQRRLKNIDWERERLRIHYQKNKPYYYAKCAARRALRKKATQNQRGILKFIKLVKSKPLATCYYCESQFPSRKAHFDHIVALSKGGSHSVENLCVACGPCNLSKHNKPLRVWIKSGQQILEL